MRTYIPLELGLIEQGQFLTDINADLDTLHRGLAQYMEEYGDEAEGVKAELVVKLTLQAVDPKDGHVSIKGTTKVVLPCRPPSLSRAMVEEDDVGLGLLVKRAGSEQASPRQGSLVTQKGEIIDPETGEVTGQ